MAQVSAGLLLYRRRAGELEVLLVHPGGPLWKNKDLGAWTIPKGLADPDEDLIAAARREFCEETGAAAPDGAFLPLGSVRLKSGKLVHAWAVEGDIDISRIESNRFEMEWPPRSGKRASFPEIDRAEYFALDEARRKINAAQVKLIDVLQRRLAKTGAEH
jgi:predicted NUDIX family NTP pyrophosphohydrolase